MNTFRRILCSNIFWYSPSVSLAVLTLTSTLKRAGALRHKAMSKTHYHLIYDVKFMRSMPKNLVIPSSAALAGLGKPQSMSGIAQTWERALLTQASATSLLLCFVKCCLESSILHISKYCSLLKRFLILQHSLIFQKILNL